MRKGIKRLLIVGGLGAASYGLFRVYCADRDHAADEAGDATHEPCITCNPLGRGRVLEIGGARQAAIVTKESHKTLADAQGAVDD